MAKRTTSKAKPDETQEMPTTVETVQAEPLKTAETVEVTPAEAVTSEGATESGKRSSGSTEAASPLPPDTELQWIINEDTGETRQVTARAGYAPAPMPFGFRLAKADEVPS